MATFTAIKNKAQGGGAMGRALDYVCMRKARTKAEFLREIEKRG